MAQPLQVREMTEHEQKTLGQWMRSYNEPRWKVERATMIILVSQHQSASQVARRFGVRQETVSTWVHRFNDQGLDGLRNHPRSGRPAIYTVDEVSLVIASALTPPQALNLPFGSWTLDRLQSYLEEMHHIHMKRSRIDEILLKEGLRWRKQERWFGVKVDPDFAQKRGPLLNSTKGRRPRASSCV